MTAEEMTQQEREYEMRRRNNKKGLIEVFDDNEVPAVDIAAMFRAKKKE